MAKTGGTGLLMVWTDVDPEFEAEFNRWYDEEHIARLLQVPGFLSAGRYVAVKGAPKYLAMYELEDHNVLRSTAYLDTVKYQPSPQRTKTGTSRIGRNFLRNAYPQIFPAHTNPIEQTVEMAPFLQMGRIDVPAAIEEEFNAWYNTAYVPGYLAVPGCLGARRFIVVEGQPKYLTVYEFEHARVSETEAWSRARSSNPWTRRVQPNLRHDDGSPGVYQRISHLSEMEIKARPADMPYGRGWAALNAAVCKPPVTRLPNQVISSLRGRLEGGRDALIPDFARTQRSCIGWTPARISAPITTRTEWL